MQTIITNKQVEELLPQKFPFQMVSALYEYRADYIQSGFQVEENNLFFENGGFNESGMLENIAQTTALHTSYGFYLRQEVAPVGYIGAISNVKVYALPTKADKLITEVNILTEFMGVTMVEGRIMVNGQVMIEAKMKTVIAQ